MIEPTPPLLTFEQALAELDRIVRELEDGKTGLEDSLARYEQGVALLSVTASCAGSNIASTN